MADDDERDEDEEQDDPRFEELRAEFRDSIGRLEKAIKAGSEPRVKRASRALEDEFSEEEISQLRETREYERFRRMAERYAQEREREAKLNGGADDDENDEEKPKPARKRKPAVKARGGRHEQEEPEPEEEAKGPLAWLLSD